MIEHLNKYQRILFIFLVLFITTFSNYFLNLGNPATSTFSISIGFSFGFYLYFRNKALPNIALGLLFSHIISRSIFIDNSFLDTFLRSAGITIIIVFSVYISVKIRDLTSINGKISFKSSLYFIFTTILVSSFAGILMINMMIIGESTYSIGLFFLKWFSSYFFGIFIFGGIVLFDYFYKEKINLSIKTNALGAIFITSFVLVASILFSETISWFDYGTYAFIFIVFYIILAFNFSYRMIMVTNITFVILFQLFQIRLAGDKVPFDIFLSVQLYLSLLSSFAILAKMAIYELAIKNSALVTSQQKLENLVYSTDSLLKLSDDILDTDVKVQENYLSRIFKIACNIFDNYDFAACYIVEDPLVNFIDAVGYNVDDLNNFKIKSNNIDYIDIENLSHIVNKDKSLRRTLENRYDDFTDIYPKMSETIRFGIYIDSNTIACISFDILESNDKKFAKAEFENLKSFQKLMNSFFSINYLNYKNISLKNDIVLSLIRTLELYDQYTGGHSEEVAHLANEISKRCGIDENEMHDIYWAGVVHDIGKVGIDSSIINKPAKLSLEEYEVVKNHSMFGYEILNKADDLKKIAILVKHHHEWWNGAGYPSGLKGENIPLGSQIISVCDAVSTMAKKRPYTIVKTSREIIEELKMYQGVQFSPIPAQKMIEFIEEGYLDAFFKNR